MHNDSVLLCQVTFAIVQDGQRNASQRTVGANYKNMNALAI